MPRYSRRPLDSHIMICTARVPDSSPFCTLSALHTRTHACTHRNGGSCVSRSAFDKNSFQNIKILDHCECPVAWVGTFCQQPSPCPSGQAACGGSTDAATGALVNSICCAPGQQCGISNADLYTGGTPTKKCTAAVNCATAQGQTPCGAQQGGFSGAYVRTLNDKCCSSPQTCVTQPSGANGEFYSFCA